MISGFLTAAELTLTFSAPARRTLRMSSTVRIPAANGKWNEYLLGRPANHVDHDVPAVG